MRRRILAAMLASALLLGICGCAEGEPNITPDDFGMSVDVGSINRDPGIHLRDKDLLYTMYDNTEIVTMYLTVSEGNTAENTNHTWEEINTYSADDYDAMGVDRYQVAGLIQVGDENGLVPGELGFGQVAPNCTVQIRGQTSSKNPQKNYKIKIKDNKGDWRGQTTIALNKHQTDGLRFRNKLCFDLLTGIDEIMSLRTTFVHLYVKDTTEGGSGVFEDYGIYTQVEQLNKTALKTHGLDKNGHLYKVNTCEFFRYEDEIKLKDDPAFNFKAFEAILETKGDDDHTKLITLLEKINDYSIPTEDILRDHFDIENIAYWMAFQLLIGNIDTQNRNFYIYSPQNSDRWYILPWDLDGTLCEKEYEIKSRSDYASWERGVSNYWGNQLFKRFLKSAEYREALDKAVEDVYAYLSEERMNAYIDTYKALLKPYVYSGRDARYAPLTSAQYDTICAALPEEIGHNYARYKESFKKPMPFYIGSPQKTETGLLFTWDSSYDFDSEDITYTFELATDYLFTDPIVKKEGIRIPEVETDMLPKGQYFIRVRARNESGYEMDAFDCYMIQTGKVYGTRCFYVYSDGTVVEDVYVEG